MNTIKNYSDAAIYIKDKYGIIHAGEIVDISEIYKEMGLQLNKNVNHSTRKSINACSCGSELIEEKGEPDAALQHTFRCKKCGFISYRIK